MAKRRQPPPTRGSNTRLDSPLDTSGTHAEGLAGQSTQGSVRYLTEKVEPVFKGAAQDTTPRWFSDIPPLAKSTAAILVVIVAFGAPSVWWISRLDTNIEILKTVVAEIRGRTDDIFRTSVQHGGRIDNLEKSMEATKAPQVSPAQTAPFQKDGKNKK